MSSDPTFDHGMERIDSLIETLEATADARSRAAARELVQRLLDLHRAGFAHLLTLLRQDGATAADVLDACLRDDRIRSLLLLHELHPETLEARLSQAIDKTRPLLEAFGAKATLAESTPLSARFLLRGADGEPLAAVAAGSIRRALEQAVLETAPDVTSLIIVVDSAGPDWSRILPILSSVSMGPSRNAASVSTAPMRTLDERS